MHSIEIVYQILEFIRKNMGALWWFGNHHPPIITPNAYKQMEYYGITYKELIGAFHSPHIESGYKQTATCGIAHYYGKVVGAVYKRDDTDHTKWAIIACWAYNKKSSDFATGRRVWKSWKWGPPTKWKR